MSLTLLLGGARSGKSRLAVEMAMKSESPVVVIATGEARDEEMAARIARHRAERPPHWNTIEEPVDVGGTLSRAPAGTCVILDCLTLWTSNLLEQGRSDADLEDCAAAAARVAAERDGLTIAVTNEVGLGIVPADAATRRYRDALGRVNAIWAARSDRAVLVVAGRTLTLEPSHPLMTSRDA